MKQNIYCARDVVSGNVLCCFMATTDGMAIRDNLGALSRVIPLKDLDLLKIGELDTDLLTIKSIPYVKVDNDAYKFPEAPVEHNDKSIELDASPMPSLDASDQA